MAETGLVFKLPVKCSNTDVKMNSTFANIATRWFSIRLTDTAMCRVVFGDARNDGHTNLTVQVHSRASLERDVPLLSGPYLGGYRSVRLSKVDLCCGSCQTSRWSVPDFSPIILTLPFSQTVLLTNLWSHDTYANIGNMYPLAYDNFIFNEGGSVSYRSQICSSLSHDLHVTVTFDVMPEPATNRNTPSVLLTLHDGLMSDVTLRVGEKDLKAHRCVLAASSHVFQAMFESGKYVESQQGFVEIEDFPVEVIEAVLRHVYGKELQPQDATSLTEILRFAEKYELIELKKLCEILLSQDVSLDALSLLAIADINNANTLAEAIIDRIANSQNRASIMDGESAKALVRSNPDVVVKLLMRLK